MKKIFTIFAVLAIAGVMSSVEGSTIPSCQYSINNSALKNSEMNQKEVWKDVVGYEGLYEVSNLGKVKSLERSIMRSSGKTKPINERIMKPSMRSGYYLVVLSNFGQRAYFVHRLKAIAFISNPNNKPQVNHRDGIKTNNAYNIDGEDNLEWVTAGENIAHAFATGLMKRPKAWLNKKGKDHPSSKPVNQYALNGRYIRTFESARQACNLTGTKGHISCVCRGERNQTGGYKWKFKNN